MTTTRQNDSEATRRANSMMRQRQRPLVRLYKEKPAAALIEDGAHVAAGALDRHDAVHGELVIGTSQPIAAPLSIHSAVGGDHDGPNPGDYLAAALGGCFYSTFRVVADRLGIELEQLEVSVKAQVDVRGTLCVSPEAPVGFQRMRVNVVARGVDGTAPTAMQMLFAMTEHCCVVYQTLRPGVQIDVDWVNAAGDGREA